MNRTIAITTLGWVVVITLLHGWLNDWFEFGAARAAEAQFRIGFLPVT